jgi:hypothetical protein
VWLKPTTGEWSKSIPGTPSVSALSEANITILAGTLESAPALSAGQNNIFTDLGYGTAASYLFDNRHRFLSTLIVPSSVLSIRTTGNSKLYIYKVIYEDGSYGQSTVYNFDKYWKEYNTLGVEIASYSVSDTAKVLGGNDGGITGVIPSPHSKVVSINIQTSTGGYSSGPSGNHVQIITSGAPTWVAHNTNDTSTDSKIATAITALPAGADGATGATGPAGADSTVAGPAGADGAAGVVAPPTRVEFTATENQATKTGLTYTVGNIDCYINGVKMSGSSFTASDGVSVTFTPALSLGEEVQLIMGAAGASGLASTVSTTDPLITSNPSALGHVWVNSTSGMTYVCTDITVDMNIWFNVGLGSLSVSPPFMATGGTITTVGNYKIHTFLTSGTFTPNKDGIVDYLVVAGGGSGGAGGWGAGGGGAGGLQTATGFAISNNNPITVTVGAGGAAAVAAEGVSGSNSVFSTITSIGGGGGAISLDPDGLIGGSGGGGTYNGGNGGSGTSGQGNAGGSNVATYGVGAGGGGASGAGSNSGILKQAGAGGDGSTSILSGSSVTYAGGGGGGTEGQADRTIALGGSGGGGNGGKQNGTVATAGTDNTGSGGGGAGSSATTQSSGSGGSGIVIIRYAL